MAASSIRDDQVLTPAKLSSTTTDCPTSQATPQSLELPSQSQKADHHDQDQVPESDMSIGVALNEHNVKFVSEVGGGGGGIGWWARGEFSVEGRKRRRTQSEVLQPSPSTTKTSGMPSPGAASSHSLDSLIEQVCHLRVSSPHHIKSRASASMTAEMNVKSNKGTSSGSNQVKKGHLKSKSEPGQTALTDFFRSKKKWLDFTYFSKI